jgi:RNA recognition motif-containing protein
VFLRNLSSNITESELKTIAEEFGPTANVFSLANRRGIGFVTFYDSRDAERCVNELECRTLHQREIHTSYAYAAPDQSAHNRFAICATITARSAGPQISEDEVVESISRFGEIKSVEPQEAAGAFTVKFYDLRAAKMAVEAGAVDIGEHKVYIEFNLKEDDGNKRPQNGQEMLSSRKMKEKESEHGQGTRRTRVDDRRGYPPPPPTFMQIYPMPMQYGAVPPQGYPFYPWAAIGPQFPSNPPHPFQQPSQFPFPFPPPPNREQEAELALGSPQEDAKLQNSLAQLKKILD